MRVIGISLVQNEDRFLELSVKNALDFCDEFIIVDNQSVDNTPLVAEKLSKEFNQVSYHRINSPKESQKFIEPYINTNTWIFAVDGDEIYDPAGLKKLLPLLATKYREYWMVYGNVLHCEDVDFQKRKATGYLARPSRSMTKLYNFSLIKSWDGKCSERLHGGEAIFHNPASDEKRLRFDFESSWEESIFRCLHMVFLPRSSLDRKVGYGRLNIHDKLTMSRKQKLLRWIRTMFGLTYSSSTKNIYYRRGEKVNKDVDLFLVNDATE